jgi:hypothetical protein
MRALTYLWLPLRFLVEKGYGVAGDYLLPADRVHQQSHHCVGSVIASIMATYNGTKASVSRMYAEPIDQPAECTPPDLGPLFIGSDCKHKSVEYRSWFREKHIRAEEVQF